jgi:hypothetical protein
MLPADEFDNSVACVATFTAVDEVTGLRKQVTCRFFAWTTAEAIGRMHDLMHRAFKYPQLVRFEVPA